MTPLQQAIRGAEIEQSARFASESASLEFVFAPDFLGFGGHFPGAPVLPAAVQLMLGRHVLERWRGQACRLVGLSQAKFLKRIGPDERVLVACRLLPLPPLAGLNALRAQSELRVWEGKQDVRASIFTLDLELSA
jgi:3-hydroxyacyl-[acyl-carrier-protein] dehydratase